MTELERARGRIAELERKLSFAEEKLSFAMDQLAVLQRHVFGRKSERTPPPAVPGQLELEIELSEEDEESGLAPEDVAAAGKKKGGSRKGRQTRAALFPESLPVVVRELVPLEVQAAPERWRRIGEGNQREAGAGSGAGLPAPAGAADLREGGRAARDAGDGCAASAGHRGKSFRD